MCLPTIGVLICRGDTEAVTSSGRDSARLSLMQLGVPGSSCVMHMLVYFVAGSPPCSEFFALGSSPVSLPSPDTKISTVRSNPVSIQLLFITNFREILCATYRQIHTGLDFLSRKHKLQDGRPHSFLTRM